MKRDRSEYAYVVEGIKDRIRQTLADNDQAMRDASLKAGLSETFVKDIMRGKSTDPGVRKLERLADAMGVSRRWLLRGEGEP